jgi:hypothetical protein
MSELPFDPLALMRAHPEKLRVPGGLLTKQGPQDYVGSVPAISGTLFFNDAHTPEVREAICACFDEYVAVARRTAGRTRQVCLLEGAIHAKDGAQPR